jgi:Zn ribbon nucleic-acid-binding protein
MERQMTPPSRYIEGATCPACEDAWFKPVLARNSVSRFAGHYICSACGVQEAFDGFFWRENCLARGIRLNEAGQATTPDTRNADR